MSVGGYYALELRCDQAGGCDRNEDFIYSTRMLCREMARMEGWLLSQKGNRCFCPEHAEERRKRWT